MDCAFRANKATCERRRIAIFGILEHLRTTRFHVPKITSFVTPVFSTAAKTSGFKHGGVPKRVEFTLKGQVPKINRMLALCSELLLP
jgi:hypothetical protein